MPQPVGSWREAQLPHLPSTCRRVQRHPFERIATPFQVYSWTAPQAEHAMDCVRAEDAYTSRLGYEEHIPGQVPALGFCLPSPGGGRAGSGRLWAWLWGGRRRVCSEQVMGLRLSQRLPPRPSADPGLE